MIMERTMIVKDLFNICEIELIYKNRLKASQRPVLKDSRSTYEFLLQVWDMNTIELTEKIVVILLNHASHVLGIYRASSGSAISCTMDLRTVFAVALKSSATRIILAHYVVRMFM
jgi:DNA repair protein RadC